MTAQYHLLSNHATRKIEEADKTRLQPGANAQLRKHTECKQSALTVPANVSFANHIGASIGVAC